MNFQKLPVKSENFLVNLFTRSVIAAAPNRFALPVRRVREVLLKCDASSSSKEGLNRDADAKKTTRGRAIMFFICILSPKMAERSSRKKSRSGLALLKS